MYRRFLNNKDYLSIISEEHLEQMVRGREEAIIAAEESAEASIVDYLTEMYEVEKELNVGRYIAPYNKNISYPSGAHIYVNGDVVEVIKAINGQKKPASVTYWREYYGNENPKDLPRYSQMQTYKQGDKCLYNEIPVICENPNGLKFNNIRLPLCEAWVKVNVEEWEQRDYEVWDVVKYQNDFYTLINKEGFDNLVDPHTSQCWGAIADYDESYNEYEVSETEYVVYEGGVFFPVQQVNSDEPEMGVNIAKDDPRNPNIKKHMVRLAIYEMCKLIAPNNVPVIRVNDYNNSIQWLKDAGKLKLNPRIERKLSKKGEELVNWQIETFQSDYNPFENAWHI